MRGSLKPRAATLPPCGRLSSSPSGGGRNYPGPTRHPPPPPRPKHQASTSNCNSRYGFCQPSFAAGLDFVKRLGRTRGRAIFPSWVTDRRELRAAAAPPAPTLPFLGVSTGFATSTRVSLHVLHLLVGNQDPWRWLRGRGL